MGEKLGFIARIRSTNWLPWVYRGAAILILVFGFRTLVHTTDLEAYGLSPEVVEKWLTLITGFSLIFEFLLLLVYASTYDSKSTVQETTIQSESSAINDKLYSRIIESLDKNTSAMDKVGDELIPEIQRLNSKIDEITENQIEHKIIEFISGLVSTYKNK